jgi:hypothetical protein
MDKCAPPSNHAIKVNCRNISLRQLTMGPSLIHGTQGVKGFFQRWIVEPNRF